MEKEYALKYGEILAKCWEDEAFKKRFITEADDVMAEFGLPVEEGVEYKVIQAPKLVNYMVLPNKNVKEAAQNLAKVILQAAEQSDVVIPEGVEWRVIQNTEDVHYLVLPASPKTLTAAELALAAGGKKTDVHVAKHQVQAVQTVEVVTTGVTTVEGALHAVAGLVVVCGGVLV